MSNDKIQVVPPVRVVDAPGLKIDEYFGNVASRDGKLSVAVCTVLEPGEEAWQTPEFDEYVVVLEGEVHLHLGEEQMQVVSAGQGAFLPAGTRVHWVWPGPCKYMPLCLPAFSPQNCHREEPTSSEQPSTTATSGESKSDENILKTDEAMLKLKQLHARSRHPFVYHAAEKKRWDEVVTASAGTYYPPTFERDGSFTHGTSDATKLLDVLNHFYQPSVDDWVLLRMTLASLEKYEVETIFEDPAAVGDTKAVNFSEDNLFPHIQGGIPVGAVLETFPIRREEGKFVAVEGGFAE